VASEAFQKQRRVRETRRNDAPSGPRAASGSSLYASDWLSAVEKLSAAGARFAGQVGKRVGEEVADGQAAMGGSFAGSASIGGGVTRLPIDFGDQTAFNGSPRSTTTRHGGKTVKSDQIRSSVCEAFASHGFLGIEADCRSTYWGLDSGNPSQVTLFQRADGACS
jgi:hypothetical protein